MPKLPSYRRILEQDYPDKDQELVRQLSVSLNNAFDVLFQLLNGKLTFADNLSSVVKEVDVTVDSAGKPLTRTVVKKASTDKVLGLMVVRAQNLINPTTFPTSGIIISYTETTDSIVLDNVTGLQPNQTYRLNVIGIR